MIGRGGILQYSSPILMSKRRKILKDNWREEYLERLNNDLNDRISELEKENERLEKENEHLKKKDKVNQETIKSIRQIEFEYYKNLEELKTLREKYKKVISEARTLRNEYSSKFKDIIKEIHKDIKQK